MMQEQINALVNEIKFQRDEMASRAMQHAITIAELNSKLASAQSEIDELQLAVQKLTIED